VNKRNYQLEMDRFISRVMDAHARPGILLQCCCAPCSTYVLSYLCKYFDITLYFCNPNMDSKEEYDKRAEELIRLVDEMDFSDPGIRKPDVVIADYDADSFEEIVKGLENEPERGSRCRKCYELRLRKTAEFLKDELEKSKYTKSPLHALNCSVDSVAEDKKYRKASENFPLSSQYFCTTLTLSPKKDAEMVNEIGEALAKELGLAYLPSDFKCKGGYEKSYELSEEFGLYRQDYCGCRFSKRNRCNQ